MNTNTLDTEGTEGIEPGALLLDFTEAGRRLGIGRTSVYKLVADGELDCVHIGRRALIVADSCPAFVARLREEP